MQEVFDANCRFFVPDLSPQYRDGLRGVPLRWVFVAESPHRFEVAPEALEERRPLCGKAGRDWWKTLGEITEGVSDEDVTLERMLGLARKHRFAILNAVCVPLDPKIVDYYGPESDPHVTVGFAKAGDFSYKKRAVAARVNDRIEDLARRISRPEYADAQIVSLGLDALWFTERALGRKPIPRIAHPSAWWRRGGQIRVEARKQLEQLFATGKVGLA